MGLFDLISGKPSQERFAAMVTEAFRAAGIDQVGYDAGNFRLVLDGDESRIVNLGNFYTDYCNRKGAERREVIPRAVRALSQTPEAPKAFDEARSFLIPRVREEGFLESMRLQVFLQMGEDSGLSPAGRPFAESFTLSLGLDYPDAISIVSESMLDDWGVTFDEALEVAQENLWSRSKENFEKLLPGLYSSPWHDDLDTSRLFLPDLIRQVPVKGDHVAAIPNRSHLLVTGSEDPEGLAALAASIIKLVEDEPHRQVSAAPVVLRDHQWRPFLPEPVHELYEEFRRLHIRAKAAEYEGQKELLDTVHEKQGSDLFVASVMLTSDEETGVWSTHAVWSAGIDTLLPKVDSLYFYIDETETIGPVPWAEVERITSDLLISCSHAPERYRTKNFPVKNTLETLRSICQKIDA